MTLDFFVLIEVFFAFYFSNLTSHQYITMAAFCQDVYTMFNNARAVTKKNSTVCFYYSVFQLPSITFKVFISFCRHGSIRLCWPSCLKKSSRRSCRRATLCRSILQTCRSPTNNIRLCRPTAAAFVALR